MSENNNGERISVLESTVQTIAKNVEKILDQNTRFLEKTSIHEERLEAHKDEIKSIRSKTWAAISAAGLVVFAVIINRVFP